MAGKQPKPVRLGAFGRFFEINRASFMKESGGNLFAATKLGNQRFKELGDVEKAWYQEMYEAAKQKYVEDMAAFKEAGGVLKPRKIKKKCTSDPKKPKRPVAGAYGCFVAKNRAGLIKECPGKTVTAVSRLASERWKQLNEVQRLPFEEEFQTKRARYQELMKSYVPPAKPIEVLEVSESSNDFEEVDFPDTLDIEDGENTGYEGNTASEVDVSKQIDIEDGSGEDENKHGAKTPKRKAKTKTCEDSDGSGEKNVEDKHGASDASALATAASASCALAAPAATASSAWAAADQLVPSSSCIRIAASSSCSSSARAAQDSITPASAAAAGCNVVVHGLVAMPHFNGKRGKLIRYLDDRARWVCLLKDCNLINLRDSQFKLVEGRTVQHAI